MGRKQSQCIIERRSASRCWVAGLLFVLLLSGCVKTSQEEIAVPLRLSDQVVAENNEQRQEYLQALRYWKSAKDVVNDKIDALSQRVKDIASDYAHKGELYYKQKNGRQAIDNFHLALRYDPSNQVALDYLLHRYEPRHSFSYVVLDGDTYEKIANNVYGSYEQLYLVKNYSGLKSESDLKNGVKLRLPIRGSFFSQPLIDYKRDIAVARKLYNDENYKKLLPVAKRILKQHPDDDEAGYIVNVSLLRIAKSQQEKGRYDAAIDTFAQIDPTFRDVQADIEQTLEMKRKKVKVESTLANASLLQKGEVLYAEKKYLEAMEIFNRVDPEYGGLEQALSRLSEKLEEKADRHYKQGVKLFINDNLIAAISEWEQTLQYDPHHRKAMNYTVKAQKLLEKYQNIRK